MRILDMRTDATTKPTKDILQAMNEVETKDYVFGEDNVAIRFEEDVAKMFGKERALIFPTTTMANLAAVMCHCYSRFQDVIIGDLSHFNLFEQGGISQLAGLYPKVLQTCPDGTIPLEEITKMLSSPFPNDNKVGLVCIENPHNFCGGTVLPLPYLEQVGKLCKSHGVKLHLDGARVFDAAVYLNVPVDVVVKQFDSVSFSLGKAVNAPFGSILAGDKEFIERASIIRVALGGEMRKLGMLASAASVGMENLMGVLVNNHRNARNLARAIDSFGSEAISLNLSSVHTNFVLGKLNLRYWNASEFCKRMEICDEKESQVLGEDISVILIDRLPDRARFAFHNDVSGEDTTLLIKKILYVLEEKHSELQNINVSKTN